MAKFSFVSPVTFSFTDLLMEIKEGTVYTHAFDEKRYTRNLYDWQRIKAAGSYNLNNGVLVIVNEDGREYVTPCWDDSTLRALCTKGFRENKSLFVPFSNWEQFEDPELQERWKALWGVAKIMRLRDKKLSFLAACKESANLHTDN
ncbi:MAG: hypothetical protein ACOX0Z_00205 [Candidatus Nanosyncoccaceae bacterium]|jgi:hypothetical protein